MYESKTTDKLTDKAFSRLMVTSILGIFFTIVMLCSVTWAWFQTGISSSNNTLRTAQSSVSLTVQNGEDLGADGSYVMAKDSPYTVTLSLGDGDTANAYCEVIVDSISYYSEQLYALGNDRSITFTLQFSEDTDVEILSRWGIPNAERAFADEGFYLDLTEADPSTVKKTPAETAKTEESKAPAEETKAPDETTEAPGETTEEPSETTEAPDETTEAPDETTEAPDETTEAPSETTEAPDETTEAPGETTEEPLVN